MNMAIRRSIEKMEFASGLAVEIYDACRPVAGERWLVAFECDSSADLAGLEKDGDEGLAKAIRLCRKVFGDTICDTQHRERNFIPTHQKEQVFTSLVESFKHDRMPYWRHPEFPRRMVLAKAREVSKNPWKFGLTPEAFSK